MLFTDIIAKKRDNLELTTEEINYFVDCVINNTAKDYQISALLMAIFINSLNHRETADLTMAMANSGKTLDLSEIAGIKVDKHSTGGVADTTTLVLAPLVACFGVPVVKMSGKGLGHTGGTIDKLNSIPNFKTSIQMNEAIEQVKKIGVVIMEQTRDLAPADKALYALRDVTATVDSLPLIASSIMSKKIATGADAIVLDVKCGSGAFMKDLENAQKLSNEMVEIGNKVGRKVVALITDMNQPLGNTIGNSLEVIEAIEILKGNISGELKDVALTLGGYMLLLGKKFNNLKEAKENLEKAITDGRGLEKFRQLIIAQGGNPNVIEDYSLFPIDSYKLELKADKSGYLADLNTLTIGKASVETGAGRHKKEDSIDYGAGIILRKRLGDKIEKDEIIAEIFTSNKEKAENAMKILKTAFVISEDKPAKQNIILDIIGAD